MDITESRPWIIAARAARQQSIEQVKLVMRYPDLRDKLCQPPLGYDKPEQWHGYSSAIREAIRTAQISVSWPAEQQPADVVTAGQQQPFVADADTPVGRIGVWLTAWKRYFGTLGLPFGADLIAGPPPSAEPRVSAYDFDVVLEVLAVVLAERARSATAEQQQDGAPPRRVCLCGSTRFRSELDAANRTLTLAGHIVLAPGVFAHSDGVPITEAEKTALDALHFAKIDLADEVFVVNPGGYIGSSTANEIAYATKCGTPVRYLVEES